ncbi:uncharacterized protein PAC_10538 [Phialocephala subalpina]|uniref:Uncharacterized protein n=1 Tax=Phialocephala subalpina TaxID=576137 RepID=A0A1L7X6K8_9HELO|nr:uncharacterized protein PAC_10538 [Phialocephala subalpina]
MEDSQNPDQRPETPDPDRIGSLSTSNPPQIVITRSSTPPRPTRRRSSEISPKTLQVPSPSPPKAQWLRDAIRRGSHFEPSKDDTVAPLSFGKKDTSKGVEEDIVAPLSFGKKNVPKSLQEKLQTASTIPFELPDDPAVAPLSLIRKSSAEKSLDKLLSKFPKPPSSPPTGIQDSPNTIIKKLSKFAFPKRSTSPPKFGPFIVEIEKMAGGKGTSPSPSPPGSPSKPLVQTPARTPGGPPPTPPLTTPGGPLSAPSSGKTVGFTPPRTPGGASTSGTGALTPGTVGGSSTTGASTSPGKTNDSNDTEIVRTTPSPTASAGSADSEAIQAIRSGPGFSAENLSDVESDKSDTSEGSHTPPANDDTAGGLFNGRSKNHTKPLPGKVYVLSNDTSETPIQETVDILQNERESLARYQSDNVRFLAALKAAASKTAGGSGGPTPLPPSRKNSSDNSSGGNGSGEDNDDQDDENHGSERVKKLEEKEEGKVDDSDDNKKSPVDKSKVPEKGENNYDFAESSNEGSEEEDIQEPNYPGTKLPPGGKPGGPKWAMPPPLHLDVSAFRHAARDLDKDSECNAIVALATKAINAALDTSRDNPMEMKQHIVRLTELNITLNKNLMVQAKELKERRTDKQFSEADMKDYIDKIKQLETQTASLANDNNGLQAEIQKLKQDAATDKQQNDTLQTEKDGFKAELEKLKDEANGKIPQEQCEEEKAQFKRQLTAARTAIGSRDQSIAKLQGERNALAARILELNSAGKVRDLILENHKTRITAFDAEITELKERLRNSQYADDAEEKSIEARIDELEEFIQALDDTYLITNKDCEERTEEVANNLNLVIEGLHKHNADLEAGSFSGNSALDKLNKQINDLKNQLKTAHEKTLTTSECDAQKATLAADIEQLKQDIMDLKEQLSTAKTEKKSLGDDSKEKADRDAQITTLIAEIERLKQDIAALQAQIQTAGTENKSTQENNDKAQAVLQGEINTLRQQLIGLGSKTLTEDECAQKHKAEVEDLKAQIKKLETDMLGMISMDLAAEDLKKWQEDNKELGEENEQLRNLVEAAKLTPGIKTLTNEECNAKYREAWGKEEKKYLDALQDLEKTLQDTKDALDAQRIEYTNELAAQALQFEEEAKSTSNGKITLIACALQNKAQNDKLESQIAKLERDVAEAVAAHDQMEARLEGYKRLDANERTQLEKLRSQVTQLESDLEAAKTTSSQVANTDGLLTEEECADKNKAETDKLQANINRLKQLLDAARQVVPDPDDSKTLRQRIAELDSELEGFKNQVKYQEDELKARGLLQEEKDELEECNAEVKKLKREIKYLNEASEPLTEKITELEECNEEVKKLKATIKDLNEASGPLTEKIAELEKEIEGLKDTLTRASRNIEFLQRINAQTNENLQKSQQKEIDATTDLEDATVAFNDMVDRLNAANREADKWGQAYEAMKIAVAQREEDLVKLEHKEEDDQAKHGQQLNEMSALVAKLKQELQDLAAKSENDQLIEITRKLEEARTQFALKEWELKEEMEANKEALKEIKKQKRIQSNARDKADDTFVELYGRLAIKEGTIASAMQTIEQTRAAISESEKEVARLQAKITELEAQLAAAKAASDGSSSDGDESEIVKAANEEIDRLRAQIADLQKKLAGSGPSGPPDNKPLDDCNDEVKQLNLEIEDLVRKLQQAERDIIALGAKKTSNQAAPDNWAEIVDDLELKIADLEAQLNTRILKTNRLQTELSGLERKLREEQDDNKNKQAAIDTRNGLVAYLEAEIKDLKSQKSALVSHLATIDQTALDDCNAEVARLQAILDEQSSSDNSLFKSLKAEIGGPDLESVIADLRSQVADAERELASSPTEDLSRAKDEIARLQLHVAELSEFEGQVVGLKNHIDQLSNEIVRLQKVIKRLTVEEGKLVTAQNQVQRLASEVARLKKELAAAKAATSSAANATALQQCNETVARLERELAAEKANTPDAKDVQKINSVVARVEAEVARLEKELAAAKTSAAGSPDAKALQKCTSEVERLEAELTASQDELAVEKAKPTTSPLDADALQQCNETVARLERELSAAKGNASESSDAKALPNCVSEVSRLEAELSASQGNLAKFTKHLQSAHARVDELTTINEGLQAAVANGSSAEIKKLKAEIKRLQDENLDLQEDEDTLERAQLQIDYLKDLLANLYLPDGSSAIALQRCTEEIERLRAQITALNQQIEILNNRSGSPEPVAVEEVEKLRAVAAREKRRYDEQKRRLEAYRDQNRRTDALTRVHQLLLDQANIPFPALGSDGKFSPPRSPSHSTARKKTNKMMIDEPEPLTDPPIAPAHDPNDPVYSIQEVELAILRARTELNFIISLRAQTGFVEGDLQTAIQASTTALEMVSSFSPQATQEERLGFTAEANFWNFLILYYSDDHIAAAEVLREADRYRAHLLEEEREAVSEWVAYDTLPIVAKTREGYGGGGRKRRTASGSSAGSGLSARIVKKPKKAKKDKGKAKATGSDIENEDAKKSSKGKKDKKPKKDGKAKKEKTAKAEKLPSDDGREPSSDEEKLLTDADLGFRVAVLQHRR